MDISGLAGQQMSLNFHYTIHMNNIFFIKEHIHHILYKLTLHHTYIYIFYSLFFHTTVYLYFIYILAAMPLEAYMGT